MGTGKSGIYVTGNLTGIKSSPKERKGVAEDEGNFILRDLEQHPALQKIIRRSFKGGTEITAEDIGSLQQANITVTVVQRAANTMEAKRVQSGHDKRRALKTSGTWREYERESARERLAEKARDILSDIIKRLK